MEPWARDGTGLLDTVGGSIARWGRDATAGIPTVHGGVPTVTELAVQAGLINASASLCPE